MSAARFTPSARTAWHTHAAGQTLYITGGHGLHQPRGGKTGEIRAGDNTCTPAGERHRHRATTGHFITHLPITQAVPSGQRPKANRGKHLTDQEHTSADAIWRPFPASRSTPLTGMTGVRRQADPPDLRPLGSMPSRHIGSAEGGSGGSCPGQQELLSVTVVGRGREGSFTDTLGFRAFPQERGVTHAVSVPKSHCRGYRYGHGA